ncbi:D-alanyl-D-alanine carboxypeptidase [Clostridium sp. SYSU_GA19001]|uniref:D-alanyl-D-alanine carboxypeptidase family protein n=1 Tax=Clostridium caldaquaticum TaxID=2940653 RepID=UPI0020774698|nr:D-alanyl-D-alanine carboxypeptidase family protein [Clostridium caldaquaticum]MCM8710387.1 D-alanyl-D-alanine carboxypeptidase [Clostridium caldaquaticum]
MKNFSIFLLIFILLFSNINIAMAKDAPPVVSADSVVLIDATTGTILYSKNMNTAYPPASTTKIMTALLTIENTNLNDVVKVSQKTPFVDGSKIGLFQDEEITVKNLLYGLLLLSGNDCAEALAEHIGGSIENFAKLMTERAKELGCENTNFINPSGLYDENHKISAKDLALIMKEAVKHPEFREIASTFSYKIPPTNKHPEGIYLANENKLINKYSLYYYDGAEAGKTGYTVQSKHSYVASAIKNGQRLIVALVHDSNKTFYEDAKKLFNYGFNNYELIRLYKQGDNVATYSLGDIQIPLNAAEDYYYVKEKESEDIPKYKLIESSLKTKTFKKEEQIMEASITLKDKQLPNLKLTSGIDYESNFLFNPAITETGKNLKINPYILSAISIAVALITATVIIKIRKKRNGRLFYK